MNLTVRARYLRKHMTDAERHLWYRINRNQLEGLKFRRQVPIGSYVVDFVCFEKKLVIEVDGGQHLESETDKRRTVWLRSQGFRVIRFWNHDVLSKIDSVLETILRCV